MADSSPYPNCLGRLIDAFAKMPGVGRATAERMAFYCMKTNRDEALELARAIHDIKTGIRQCTRCFHIAEHDVCDICANPARENGQLCIVEMPRDVIAIEKTGAFRGQYHVLLGHLAPTEGIEPENLKIRELIVRLEQGHFEEVILATNPTAEGDVTASYLEEELARFELRITRLARGIPIGGEIETAGRSNLETAIRNRG